MRVFLRRHAATFAVALLTAAVVAAPPVAAHVTKAVKHTWKHIRPLADARYQLKGTPVTWSSIQGIPAGFADNTDNEGTTGPATDLNCTACVQESELAFDSATQSELNDHKSSGDHDARYWKLTGNALAGTEFLGSTNNQALNFRVNDVRALRLEPNGTEAANVIGGAAANAVTSGVVGATISGGGTPETGLENIVTDDRGTVGGGVNNQAGDAAGTTSDRRFATVGGGTSNTASGDSATVGGGLSNTASGFAATVGGGGGNTASGSDSVVGGGDSNEVTDHFGSIGGGQNNQAGDAAGAADTAQWATVSGGLSNTASAQRATVAGGAFNTASGDYATVAGGIGHLASGHFSYAAGRGALAEHDGAFMWVDSCNNAAGSAQCPASASFLSYSSTAVDQFSVRATGGVRFVTAVDASANPSAGATLAPGASSWGVISDRAAKENVAPVDGRVILDRLSSIPMATWNWKTQDEAIRHIGPMAQDFHAAFGVGEDDKHITTVDADGVALAAIQGLNDKLTSLEERVAGPGSGSSALAVWQVLAVLGLALGIALGGRGIRRQAVM